MARVLSGSSDYEKLQELCSFTYKEQAVWFLNAFWEQFGEVEAEKIWSHTLKFNQLDEQKKADGNALDEFFAHRFLELVHETLTVHAMRDKLRAVGAIGQTDRPKVVPLIHYLIWKYGSDWKFMVNAPQGSKEEVAKAEQLLREVQAAFQASQQADREAAEALRESTAAEAQAKSRESDAKQKETAAKQRDAEAKETAAQAKETESLAQQREAESVQREAESQQAKSELEAALEEVRSQEAAYHGRTEQLKRLSEEGGLVSRNKAKNELAQHLGEDPLPLRRAKITLEAAVKKADRAANVAAAASQEAANASAAASEARNAADASAKQASSARAQAEASAREAVAARKEAEAARERSEAAKEAAEAALEEASRRLEEAEAYVEEVKKRLPLGAAWWLERELHEARAYLPTAKGGYSKKKF